MPRPRVVLRLLRRPRPVADRNDQAYEHRDPYHPRPIWDNFRGLFDSIDRGNAALGIHAYNGGLFAPDAVLDGLRVSDRVCSFFRDLGGYDYRPASQAAQSAAGESLIDVEILGHTFEQSISDLEKLRGELLAPAGETDVAQPPSAVNSPTLAALTARQPRAAVPHSPEDGPPGASRQNWKAS